MGTQSAVMWPLTVTMRWTTCCNCGVPFGMPDFLMRDLEETGKWFYCPNGHSQHFTELSSTREKKLREQAEARLQVVREERDRAHRREEAAIRSARATRGALTKVRKKVAAGLCPVAGCRRNFVNLGKHIRHMHPTYRDQEVGS